MKKYELRLNYFAQNDIEKAKDYYNSKKDGLGDEWQETKAKLEQIEKKSGTISNYNRPNP